MAVNCLEGIARLVARFTPQQDDRPAAPAVAGQEPQPGSFHALCRDLRGLSGTDAPVWGGDLEAPTAELDYRGGHHDCFEAHGFAYRLALRCAISARRDGRAAVRLLREYARFPFVAEHGQGPGRWRVIRVVLPTDGLVAVPGRAFRTATSAAVVLAGGRGDFERLLLEYAPEGDFPAAGPLAACGARPLDAHILEPVRPAAWFTRLVALWDERGPAPARPDLAADLAGRLALTVPEATVLITATPRCAPREGPPAVERSMGPGYGAREVWNLSEAEVDAAVVAMTCSVGRDHLATVYERLLPDDPELLWTQGPDVDRAAEWWCEHFGPPLPVPTELLPRAAKEIVAPKWEIAFRGERRAGVDPDSRRPHLRLPALTGRVASGSCVLDPDPTGLNGEPFLLATVRTAAWLAYRTPAGDPLRPAIAAAIGRLREELSSGPGPLTVFSLQSNYLMGDPPSTDALTAHPAVTVEEDPDFEVRHLRVDPSALSGPSDPVLDRLDAYLDSVLPSQWLPSASGLPALADLRLLLSEDFAALGGHLARDTGREPGWEQAPDRSAPHLVTACADACGLGRDAAALYLMLLALPDPTDRHVKQWTGWTSARLKAVGEELAASGRVVRFDRARAGRSLFLPGGWQELKSPRLPIEAVKVTAMPLAAAHLSAAHTVVVPNGPVPMLFELAALPRAGRDEGPR
jgi:hypothetical protein